MPELYVQILYGVAAGALLVIVLRYGVYWAWLDRKRRRAARHHKWDDVYRYGNKQLSLLPATLPLTHEMARACYRKGEADRALEFALSVQRRLTRQTNPRWKPRHSEDYGVVSAFFTAPPQYLRSMEVMGRIYLERDRLEEAVEIFEYLAGIGGRLAPLNMAYAEVLGRLNETADAANVLRRYMKIEPDRIGDVERLLLALIDDAPSDPHLRGLQAEVMIDDGAGEAGFESLLEQAREATISVEDFALLKALAEKLERDEDLYAAVKEAGAELVRRKEITEYLHAGPDAAPATVVAGSVTAAATPRVNSPYLLESGLVLDDRYRIIEPCGRGGMSTVYHAMDERLRRPVAIKVLTGFGDEFARNEERFELEAQLSAKLFAHAGVVTVLDVGDGPPPYIVMEYVEGCNLYDLIGKPDLSPARILSILDQTADVLAFAHDEGVVHRDIKPGNILVRFEPLQIKVADFGLAKYKDASKELTKSGTIVGTSLYMSPEQIKGDAVDGRSDIYSWGVTAYEMCCGQPPFLEGEVMFQHVYEKPPSLEARAAEGIPTALIQLIMRCLAKIPDRRPSDFHAVRKELAAIRAASDCSQ